MKTPTRLILMASIGSGLALAQEAERTNPTPDRPLARPEERPRPEADRPRPEADRPRPEGERPREADRPRPEGERRDGDRPRVEGERPRPDAERPRGEAERPRIEEEKRRLEVQRREGERRPEENQARTPAERRPMASGEGQGGVRRDMLARLPQKLQPYLGIVTRDAGPDLAAQLRQPEGFGLVVEEVLPDSPAKSAGLERNDLLLRFDDQALVNPPQLEALVRRAGKDKEATLTILRGGAEQKVTIRIGEKMLPERRAFPGMQPGHFPPQMLPGGERPNPSLRREPLRSEAQPERSGGGGSGDRQVRYSRDRARIVRSDEDGTFSLSSFGGTRTFSAQKPDGTSAWNGPVETPAQREALPPELRKKLEILEQGSERGPGERGDRPAEAIKP
jgi:serine protease Do